MEVRRQGDGVAVQAERHRGGQRRPDAAQPERGRDGERRQKMRGVEMTEGQPVSDVRPGDLADELDLQALIGGESACRGDDRRGGVDQRDEADLQAVRAHPRSSAAVTTDCAISEIFFFSFIATLRSRA